MKFFKNLWNRIKAFFKREPKEVAETKVFKVMNVHHYKSHKGKKHKHVKLYKAVVRPCLS